MLVLACKLAPAAEAPGCALAAGREAREAAEPPEAYLPRGILVAPDPGAHLPRGTLVAPEPEAHLVRTCSTSCGQMRSVSPGRKADPPRPTRAQPLRVGRSGAAQGPPGAADQAHCGAVGLTRGAASHAARVGRAAHASRPRAQRHSGVAAHAPPAHAQPSRPSHASWPPAWAESPWCVQNCGVEGRWTVPGDNCECPVWWGAAGGPIFPPPYQARVGHRRDMILAPSVAVARGFT